MLHCASLIRNRNRTVRNMSVCFLWAGTQSHRCVVNQLCGRRRGTCPRPKRLLALNHRCQGATRKTLTSDLLTLTNVTHIPSALCSSFSLSFLLSFLSPSPRSFRSCQTVYFIVANASRTRRHNSSERASPTAF